MIDGFSVEYICWDDKHPDYSQLYLHPRALRKPLNGMWFVIYDDKGAIELDYGSWTFYGTYGDSEPVEHQFPGGIDLTEAAHNDSVRAISENRRPVADIEVAATAALTSIMGGKPSTSAAWSHGTKWRSRSSGWLPDSAHRITGAKR